MRRFVFVSILIACFACLILATTRSATTRSAGMAYIPPELDIKCNGLDAGVIVPVTDLVILTIHIDPNSVQNYPFDIWVIMKDLTTGEMRSFGHWDPCNPDSPHWENGLCNFFWRGAIGSCIIDDIIFKHTMPLGSYKAWLVFDLTPNGNLNIPEIYDYDMVDWQVVP